MNGTNRGIPLALAAAGVGLLNLVLGLAAPTLAAAPPGPAPDAACAGIYPGLPIGVSGAGQTAGFVLRDPTGRIFMPTSSFGDVGDEVKTAADNQVIGDVRFKRLEFAWDDFMLFEVRPAFVGLVNPAVCTWGGPVGTYTANVQPPLLSRLKFHADLVITSPSPGLTACAFPNQLCTGFSVPCLFDSLGNPFGPDPKCFAMYAVATPYANGAPVLTNDGLAMGMVMGASIYDGSYAGVRLPRLLEVARTDAGLELQLVTAPLGT